MPHHHPITRIHELVQAPKVLAAGQSVEPKKHGSPEDRRAKSPEI
jgi:hypothetical protein